MKKVISLFTAVFYLFGICILNAIPVFAQTNTMALELHVEGRWIYNSKGEKVRLVGANIPDLQWSTGIESDTDERIDMLCDQWNSNVVRLCVHSKFWYGEEWYQNGDYTSYRRKVDEVINKITSRGKYVILNLHEFYLINEKNKMFWEEAAEVYKNHPGVLFGILNEPHDISWDVWRNGGYVETTDKFGDKVQTRAYGHQEILDMIRAKGARNILLVGGLDWAYYFDGLTKGYVDKEKGVMENGFRLVEPEGDLKGNGIILDTHIYPMKPEYNPVEKAVSCIIDDYPVLVGEVGHWGERLFDWYDNFLLEYAHVWNNETYDYIDRNELNYTMWSYHTGAAPTMLADIKTFEPTLHSGYAQKHRMLYGAEDNRPPENERRMKDPSPLSTWENTLGFDNNEEVLVYGDSVQAKIVDEGYKDKGLLVNFDIKAGEEGKSAAIYTFPEGTDFSGAKWMSLRIKGDGDMRPLGFGIELKDGRQFMCEMPIDLFENWKLWYLPLEVFYGPVGILDTTQIKSVYFTSLSEGVGSFTVDDVMIAGLDYVEAAPFTLSNRTSKDSLEWYAWEDSESPRLDTFTAVEGKAGKETANAVRLEYDRPDGSYGGQARATVPTSWSEQLKNAEYFSFWAKGDGSDQKFTIRLDPDKATTIKDQKSNFKKREFERFALDFEVTGSEWKFYKFRISDLGLNDILRKDRIRKINIFNRLPNKSGSLTIDDFTFTNIGDPLKESYSFHEEPKPSAPITELKTQFPKNQILHIPRTFEIYSGQDALLNMHLMNKTDKDAKGELTIEGVPQDTEIKNAKYDTFAGFVSYPHYPWREYSYTNFKVHVPRGKEGEYTITVKDASGNGVATHQYKLIVKPAKVIYTD